MLPQFVQIAISTNRLEYPLAIRINGVSLRENLSDSIWLGLFLLETVFLKPCSPFLHDKSYCSLNFLNDVLRVFNIFLANYYWKSNDYTNGKNCASYIVGKWKGFRNWFVLFVLWSFVILIAGTTLDHLNYLDDIERETSCSYTFNMTLEIYCSTN